MIKLSRCFQTLILPSLKLIGNNYILGSCKKFYIQNLTDNQNNPNNHNSNDKQVKDTNDVKDESNQINDNNDKNNDNNNFNENPQNNNLYIFDGCNRLLFNTILLILIFHKLNIIK